MLFKLLYFDIPFLYENIILNTQCVSNILSTTVSRSKNKIKFEQSKCLLGLDKFHSGFSVEQIVQTRYVE